MKTKLLYRVALFEGNEIRATSNLSNDNFETYVDFERWLTGWIDVSKSDEIQTLKQEIRQL